jgi:hypothetical protein
MQSHLDSAVTRRELDGIGDIVGEHLSVWVFIATAVQKRGAALIVLIIKEKQKKIQISLNAKINYSRTHLPQSVAISSDIAGHI